MPDGHEARIARNEEDIQDIWKKFDSVSRTIEEIKVTLLGRPSWPVMILLIVAFKIIAILGTYVIMR